METRQNGKRLVKRSITVKRPLAEVFAFWRNLENLARHSRHLESVTVRGKWSHWVVKAPAGRSVEWESEVVEELPNELLAWRSLPGSRLPNEGMVWFAPAPGDRGTEVRVELSYRAPAGQPGATLARLFGEEPDLQLRDDLRRLKQVLETGDVVRFEGSGDVAGEDIFRQSPAQPVQVAVRL